MRYRNGKIRAYRERVKAHCLKALCREKARDYGYEALMSKILGDDARLRHSLATMTLLNVCFEKLDGLERRAIAGT